MVILKNDQPWFENPNFMIKIYSYVKIKMTDLENPHLTSSDIFQPTFKHIKYKFPMGCSCLLCIKYKGSFSLCLYSHHQHNTITNILFFWNLKMCEIHSNLKPSSLYKHHPTHRIWEEEFEYWKSLSHFLKNKHEICAKKFKNLKFQSFHVGLRCIMFIS